MLRAAHDAIGARVPEAKIALGSDPMPDPGWLDRLFAVPGADAAHAFDIANVNIRDATRRLPGRFAAFHGQLARHGFTGPVWVTEHGYPADQAYQTDPAFQGGEPAQASYLTESVLALAGSGASEVFVTLRDNHTERWQSEGVVSIGEAPSFAARRKPAFAAMRRLVDNWKALSAAWAERRHHEEAARQASREAAAASLKAKGLRVLARAAARRLARLRARLGVARRPAVRLLLRRRIARAAVRAQRRRTNVGWTRAVVYEYRVRAALHRQRAAELGAFVAGR
jgi:hypothetical protein